MLTVTLIEQKGIYVWIHTWEAGVWFTTENELIKHIVDKEMSITREFVNNTSPLGDGDPRFDIYAWHTTDPHQYLEDNFDSVCKNFVLRKL